MAATPDARSGQHLDEGAVNHQRSRAFHGGRLGYGLSMVAHSAGVRSYATSTESVMAEANGDGELRRR